LNNAESIRLSKLTENSRR